MRFARGCLVAFRIGMALILAASWTSAARGDGGALRAWKQVGSYDIAVFSDPTPCVAGPVDISVLLLDRDTGEGVDNADVTVEISVAGRPGDAMRHPATRQAATNKMLRAAVFEIEDAGRCGVAVRIEGPGGCAQLRFGLDIGHAWSPRAGIWPWILWPVPTILLFLIHRRLAVYGNGRPRIGSPRGEIGDQANAVAGGVSRQ